MSKYKILYFLATMIMIKLKLLEIWIKIKLSQILMNLQQILDKICLLINFKIIQLLEMKYNSQKNQTWP